MAARPRPTPKAATRTSTTAAFASKFADRTRGLQLVETGSGDTTGWTDYLTDKEFEGYRQATSDMKSARRWGAVNAAAGVVYLSLVLGTGGTVGAISLTVAGVLSAIYAASYLKHKEDISDYRTTAMTRAMKHSQLPSSSPRKPL